MRVIPPMTITNAIFTSSTASEPLAPSVYASGTTYAIGNIIYVAADKLIYQSLVASNLGNTPNLSPLHWKIVGFIEPAWASGTTYAVGDVVSYNHKTYVSLIGSNLGNNPFTAVTAWEENGSTNKWRSLDILRNTATVQASPLTMVFTPGVRINSIALLGIVADLVNVKMTSGGPIVYDKTFDSAERGDVFDWYDYFFAEFISKSSVVAFDLPLHSNGIITVTLTRAVGNVELGSLVLGSFVDLGQTQYGAESDVLNFSIVERDEFGNSVLIPRRNVPKTIQTVWADAYLVNRIRNVRELLNAVPAVWSGLDDSTQPYFDPLLILGFYRKFTINLAYQDKLISTIELEEV